MAAQDVSQRERFMSRLPIAGRIGAVVVTGAIGVGLATAATASAAAKSVPSRCPTGAAVSKALGSKMQRASSTKPGHNILCGYHNPAGTVYVSLETLRVGNEKTSLFYSSWAQTARSHHSKFKHFRAGRAAGYFNQGTGKLDGHPTLEAEVLTGKEQLSVSLNGSVKNVEKLARHFT
jgi:hypothetical protein